MGVVYDVVIVGGGIAGLAAAHSLGEGLRVLVLEASPQFGGKLRSSQFGDAVVDEGAEQVLVRVPEALALIDAVGLGDHVVHPRTSAASVWSRGALRPLPTGTVLGVPADPVAVARSGVISPAGLLRASADAVRPRTAIGADVSVGAYVRSRVGAEVVDRLVDPLLGGVYAGRADGLSLFATVPQLAAQVRRHRTLLGAARAARADTGEAGPVFAGLVGGLGRLPVALVEVLRSRGVELQTRTTVRAIEQSAPEQFRLTTGPVPREQHVDAKSVVLAVPATPASRLLAALAPASAVEIGAIEYASVALVTLAYPAGSAAAGGSGFLVPSVEGRTTKAATFLSAKWSHLAGGLAIVRASVGRFGEQHDIQRDDPDLIESVHADVAAMAGVTAAPALSRVTRWGGGLPQYAPGHLDRVRRARAALPPGVVVCGAAYDGVGVPACVRSGQQAGQTLRQWVGDAHPGAGEAEGA